jgi:hypothetical protein
MALTRVEQERITDSRLKVQSIANSLKHIDPNKIRHFEEIQECLEDTERSLKEALRSAPPNVPDTA